MTLALRPYQSVDLSALDFALRLHQRVVYVLPTGGGKTAIGTALTAIRRAEGQRVMFLVHRAELLEQTERAYRLNDLEVGVVAPGRFDDKPVMIAMAQTLARRITTGRAPSRPRLLIVDEAHHAVAHTWEKITAWAGDAEILGLTATPARLDGRGLSRAFRHLILGPSVRTLQELGFLSGFVYFAPPTRVDMSGVRRLAGDFNTSQLESAVNRPAITGDAIEHYRRHLWGKRALAFCATVAHAEQVAAQFTAAGVPAKTLHGSLSRDERETRVAEFRDGETPVLTSCNLISEGFDVPAAQGVILLRPTLSTSLHLQQIGRALRPKADGSAAIVLDHVANLVRHGMPDDEREWSLERGLEERAAGEAPIRVCPECYAVNPISARVCHACGHAFVSAARDRQPQQREGTLEEVVAWPNTEPALVQWIRTASYRDVLTWARTPEQVQLMARIRNYKPGWVWSILRDRTARMRERAAPTVL